MNNMPLLRKLLKQINQSSYRGMTNFDEITKFTEFLDKNNTNYILLHTVSSYPLQEIHSNLKKLGI